MTDKQFKFFKRYLKERGIFNNFFKEAKKFPERRKWCSIKSYIEEYCSCTEPIMNLLLWNNTDLGNSFWAEEYQRYLRFTNKVGSRKIETINKELAYEYFEKIEKINF